MECPSFRRFRVNDNGGQNYKKRQQAVLNKAGWKCEYCGDHLANSYTVDHRIPLSKGGSKLKTQNLKAACKQCNEAKGDMPEVEFVAIITSKEPPPKFAHELLLAWKRFLFNVTADNGGQVAAALSAIVAE
jgi:5-methylcytosine-specific restriction endonuclease McrA